MVLEVKEKLPVFQSFLTNTRLSISEGTTQHCSFKFQIHVTSLSPNQRAISSSSQHPLS